MRAILRHAFYLEVIAASNFPLRNQYELIDQQQLLAFRPSRRVGGVSPYKPHHGRVHREGLRPPASDVLVRRHSRHFKELGHPRYCATSPNGRHRIAVVDFNFVWFHLPYSASYAVSAVGHATTVSTTIAAEAAMGT